MKKYKLVNGRDYSHFIEGQAYNEDVVLGSRGVSVKGLSEEYPNDWEEVGEQDTKKFKFVGSDQEAGKYVHPVRVGEVYSDDYFKNRDIDVDLISDFIWSAGDWEEVTEELVRSPKIFTDAEVVTLVTFLNDNFEDFRNFVEGEEICEYSVLDFNFYEHLEGLYRRSEFLVDKIEKNDTNLTEAEKVTIITFLNDNFGEFSIFTWCCESFYELDGEFSDTKASLLIDKIELS